MSSIYRIVILLSWVLGLLCLGLAVVSKVAHLASKLKVAPGTFLIAASTFFLCTLATRALDRS
jgi:hypothetical protein